MICKKEQRPHTTHVLLLAAGAKGAVGSTVAALVASLIRNPQEVLPWLTVSERFPGILEKGAMIFAGWDSREKSLLEVIKSNGVLGEKQWLPLQEELEGMKVLRAPQGPLGEQVEVLSHQIRELLEENPGASPVMVDLLPASANPSYSSPSTLDELLAGGDGQMPVDLAYAAAAIRCGVPFVNFTSNQVEHPLLVKEACQRGVPICGRDGKTGQTFFKVVLASALKARKLRISGWYSLNILGNEDGRNLSDPSRAASKVANKTEVLEEVLGYPVEHGSREPSHGVHIAYYPPRGDAKEAWDVIDFSGAFGLPMSLRLNLLARDSVLAAPLVVDLAVWMAGLKKLGRSGLVPELGFYFKKPLGQGSPKTFQEQLKALELLHKELTLMEASGGSRL